MIYAKSIITPFLLALFISIICAQPISWLEKKRIPRWLAILLGTPAEAKTYLENKELIEKAREEERQNIDDTNAGLADHTKEV